jgi:ribosomal protein S18 acetylase RimI-like enzyme
VEERAIVVVDAEEAHFEGIVRIERGDRSSVIGRAGPALLQEALARGHWVVVALDGGEVAGWAWFSVELGRTGEYVGQLFRVAVAEEARRSGVGRRLAGHALGVFGERAVTRVRGTVPAGDAPARAFLESLGFAADALTMERVL